jgi:2-polyprenyl-6-methoxyphenol hydroxylase-like FAD-dependent oxidoreductase
MTLATVPRYDNNRVSQTGKHAIVIGGSMAGLIAARVLTDAYDTVTVIDRDPLPHTAVTRRGVPQSSQPHVLLEAGRATLEDLFPGYCEDLITAGALITDFTSDLHHYEEGGFLAEGPTRLPVYSASRPLFEQVLRQRVAALNTVQLRPNCQSIKYRTNGTATTVTGAVVRNKSSGQEELTADLVVDATGRTSRTPEWLANHGYTPPDVDEVTVDVAYSTTTVKRPSDDRRVFFAPPDAPSTRGGGAFPMEADRWLVTMQGIHGDDPPTTMDGLREFAASLPIPHLQEILDTYPQTSDNIEQYPFPANVRRYYEDLNRFPDGLVVIGDAIACFNPIYGQGMSVAALQGIQLHHTLAADGDGTLGLRFFDKAADAIDIAWMMAVGADFAFPQTTGPKPRGVDLFNRYISRLIQEAHTDGVLAGVYGDVIMMKRPPTSLLHPSIMRRVLSPLN